MPNVDEPHPDSMHLPLASSSFPYSNKDTGSDLTLDGLLLWSKTVSMVSISDRSLPVVKFGQSLLSKTARSDLPGAPRTDMTTGKYSLRLLTHE